MKENLKIIITMIIEDVWKNYESYAMQKKVFE